MSGHAPGGRHLLIADDALDEMRRCRTYLTVCGLLLPVAELPSWECPPGCERPDCFLFCLACAAAVVATNTDAAADGQHPATSVTDSEQAGGR